MVEVRSWWGVSRVRVGVGRRSRAVAVVVGFIHRPTTVSRPVTIPVHNSSPAFRIVSVHET